MQHESSDRISSSNEQGHRSFRQISDSIRNIQIRKYRLIVCNTSHQTIRDVCRMQPKVTFELWHHIGRHAHITMQLRLMIGYSFWPYFQNSNIANNHPKANEMTTHWIFQPIMGSRLHHTMQKDVYQRIRISYIKMLMCKQKLYLLAHRIELPELFATPAP